MEESNSKKAMDPKNTSNAKFDKRGSAYRGVAWHSLARKYEAHLWDINSVKDGHIRKGEQVYLGGYDQEEKAARAYDLAALKYWGPSAITNFPRENYVRELKVMKTMSKQEYNQFIRRSSTGFSRGSSAYRGVMRFRGGWKARIWSAERKKDLYLGTFNSEEEAAEAYDIAAIKLKGEKALTNFGTRRYDVESIMNGAVTLERTAKETSVEVEDKESNGDKDNFSYTLFGISVERTEKISSCTNCIAPTTINGNATSKTMANIHGQVMSGFSLPSHTSAPAFETKLSLGTSTFCSADHESIKPDTNSQLTYFHDSDSGPSAGTPSPTPIMFNIWSDIGMPKS